MPKHSI